MKNNTVRIEFASAEDLLRFTRLAALTHTTGATPSSLYVALACCALTRAKIHPEPGEGVFSIDPATGGKSMSFAARHKQATDVGWIEALEFYATGKQDNGAFAKAVLPLERMTEPASADIELSTGRIVRHTRQTNGSQLATPTPGPAEMTPEEWTEYCDKVTPKPTREKPVKAYIDRSQETRAKVGSENGVQKAVLKNRGAA